MTGLRGKVALVTGASRGIGRATALRLAHSGAAVAVNYLNDASAAATVVESIRTAGGRAIAVAADIANVDAIETLFETVIGEFGRLDILVANAGHARFAPLVDFSEADFDRIFAVNAKGTFFCLQQASRRLEDNGAIVCLSTIGTILNLGDGAAYFGSKAAIEQFARVLATELGPRGITVNVISPGFTDTDMLSETGGTVPAAAAQICAMTPLGRLGQPDEVAAAIAFLVAPDGRWVNRQNLAADGGIISR